MLTIVLNSIVAKLVKNEERTPMDRINFYIFAGVIIEKIERRCTLMNILTLL